MGGSKARQVAPLLLEAQGQSLLPEGVPSHSQASWLPELAGGRGWTPGQAPPRSAHPQAVPTSIWPRRVNISFQLDLSHTGVPQGELGPSLTTSRLQAGQLGPVQVHRPYGLSLQWGPGGARSLSLDSCCQPPIRWCRPRLTVVRAMAGPKGAAAHSAASRKVESPVPVDTQRSLPDTVIPRHLPGRQAAKQKTQPPHSWSAAGRATEKLAGEARPPSRSGRGGHTQDNSVGSSEPQACC